MNDAPAAQGMPPGIEQVLRRFRALGREEKMQALLHYAKRLEPVPERYAAVDRAQFAVHECQTPVALFPEHRDGRMYYYAEVNARQSPTVAAFLAILLGAINGATPEEILAIPADFVRQVMEGIGLAGRESGLTGLLARIQRHAANARAA